MIKAAFFDVDGTLIDSNDLHARAWHEAFGRFGVELPFERIRGQIGKGADNLMPALLSPDVLAAKGDDIAACCTDLFQRDYIQHVRPFPGVRALFARLVDDGLKVVLASSAGKAELDHHIALLGIEDLLSGVTSRDDVEHSKPCPDIFDAAMRKVAPIEASEAVVIGDSPWDVKAAAKAGLRVIGVRSGGFPDAELAEAGAAELFDDPQDLLERYEHSLLAK